MRISVQVVHTFLNPPKNIFAGTAVDGIEDSIAVGDAQDRAKTHHDIAFDVMARKAERTLDKVDVGPVFTAIFDRRLLDIDSPEVLVPLLVEVSKLKSGIAAHIQNDVVQAYTAFKKSVVHEIEDPGSFFAGFWRQKSKLGTRKIRFFLPMWFVSATDHPVT